jgi:5-methylcytosine-specific restriction endonuclease McrA
MVSALLSSTVLLLNQNYEPLNICTVRRAVSLLGLGKATLLENGRGELRTPSQSIPIPSVIRLEYLVRRPFLRLRLSRREVFLRDGYACQYCGKIVKVLTLDHVVPRHQGGGHSWENMVTACVACNHRKAGRTPKEAGMKLLKVPRPPRANPYVLFHHRETQEEWRKFVPWLP